MTTRPPPHQAPKPHPRGSRGEILFFVVLLAFALVSLWFGVRAVLTG